jgi:hypothetical protein
MLAENTRGCVMCARKNLSHSGKFHGPCTLLGNFWERTNDKSVEKECLLVIKNTKLNREAFHAKNHFFFLGLTGCKHGIHALQERPLTTIHVFVADILQEQKGFLGSSKSRRCTDSHRCGCPKASKVCAYILKTKSSTISSAKRKLPGLYSLSAHFSEHLVFLRQLAVRCNPTSAMRGQGCRRSLCTQYSSVRRIPHSAHHEIQHKNHWGTLQSRARILGQARQAQLCLAGKSRHPE